MSGELVEYGRVGSGEMGTEVGEDVGLICEASWEAAEARNGRWGPCELGGREGKE